MNRDSSGKFVRLIQFWTGEKWDEGYVDNKGRFRVYRPDFPRAYTGGWALRAHVVWWLRTGAVHPSGTVLHHVNENRLDDRFENLEVKGLGEHTRHHCLRPKAEHVCEQCHKTFLLPKWRFKSRRKEGWGVRFCSQACYHKFPKSDATRKRHSISLKRAYKEGRRR